jgi:hypothetical protein
VDKFNALLDSQADGIALIFWVSVGALALLVAAMVYERKLRPRHERREFRHLSTVERVRREARK